MRATFFTIFLVFAVPCFPDESRWYDNFFIEGSFHQYFAPEILSEHVNPKPGFRGAFGYEYNHFRFAVESGYTNFEGTNPLVLDITIIPLTFKFGYEYPIYYGFGVQGDLLAGYTFSKVIRYPTALDVIFENLQEDNERHFLAGARIYATWTTKEKFLKIYAGGGADFIIENDGPIPLALFEAGISLKPLTLIKHSVKKPVNPVYFEVNSSTMLEQYQETLDDAGKRLQGNQSLRITIRAYYAPSGTTEWQPRRTNDTPALSAARAEQCAEYLQNNYEVNPLRIKIEYMNAGKASDETQMEMYRCVDLIIK
jgi:outer membrane protein OmpA-like peptidoglycan-associated protein